MTSAANPLQERREAVRYATRVCVAYPSGSGCTLVALNRSTARYKSYW